MTEPAQKSDEEMATRLGDGNGRGMLVLMHTGRTTRQTLLGRVRDGNDDAASWRELDTMYREMLMRFCRARGLQHADAEDVIQQVFARLLHGLKAFEYDRAKGRFRDYLYRCVRNAIADWACCQRRAGCAVEGAEMDKAESQWAESFHQEWVNHHFRRAIVSVQQSVDAQSMEVLRSTLEGRIVKETAMALGMQEMAVYKAQQRMRDRLRTHIADQIAQEDA